MNFGSDGVLDQSPRVQRNHGTVYYDSVHLKIVHITRHHLIARACVGFVSALLETEFRAQDTLSKPFLPLSSIPNPVPEFCVLYLFQGRGLAKKSTCWTIPDFDSVAQASLKVKLLLPQVCHITMPILSELFSA